MSAQNTVCSDLKYLSVCQPRQMAWSNYLWPQVYSKSVLKPWHTESAEWRRFSGSYSLPSKSVCFPPRDSRAKQRAQCLGSALPLWRSFKGPCLTDGHCLGWESMEGYSQSVSVHSFELIFAPSEHFLNTLPPLIGSFSFSASSVCHSIKVSRKCFFKENATFFSTELPTARVVTECDYFQAPLSWLLIYNEKIPQNNTSGPIKYRLSINNLFSQ